MASICDYILYVTSLTCNRYFFENRKFSQKVKKFKDFSETTVKTGKNKRPSEMLKLFFNTIKRRIVANLDIDCLS